MAELLDRYRNLITIGLAGLVAAAVVAFVLDQRSGAEPLTINLADPPASGPIEVYISGAVAEPGVYEMSDGDRIIDLLYEAGGHTPDADLDSINLALRLHDEDQVLVPRIGEAAGGLTSGVLGAAAAKTDINSATATELDGLPGIGDVYSERIVEERIANGVYVTTEELVERKIIPRATYEGIRDLITAGR